MKRVVMLTANPWRTESRVIREARALAQSSYDVHVVCDGSGNALRTETVDGVTYHCLPQPGVWQKLWILLQTHCLHAGILWRGLRNRSSRAATLKFLPSYTIKSVAAIILSPAFLLFYFVLRPFPFARGRITTPALKATGIEATLQINMFGARAGRLLAQLVPDVLHAHDLITLSGAVATRPNRDVHIVYDSHELETQTNSLAREPYRRPWVSLYEAVLIKECAAVITVSESIGEWLRDTYRIEMPAIVYNSPDLEAALKVTGESSRLRYQLQLPPSSPLAVYVGSVTIGRGIEECVRMLPFSNDLHLALVGPRHAQTEQHVREIARTLSVTDRLHFVNPVPSEQVINFIADADCSLVTIQNTCLSYYFSFPNKLLESVFAHLPVVGARLKELQYFLDRFPAGVIADETSPAALAAAVDTVIADRARFTPNAAQLHEISDIYGWQAQKRKLLHLYSNLAEASRD